MNVSHEGRAISMMIRRQLLTKAANEDQVHHHDFNFTKMADVDEALNSLKKRVKDGKLHVIVDEVKPEIR